MKAIKSLDAFKTEIGKMEHALDDIAQLPRITRDNQKSTEELITLLADYKVSNWKISNRYFSRLKMPLENGDFNLNRPVLTGKHVCHQFENSIKSKQALL